MPFDDTLYPIQCHHASGLAVCGGEAKSSPSERRNRDAASACPPVTTAIAIITTAPAANRTCLFIVAI